MEGPSSDSTRGSTVMKTGLPLGLLAACTLCWLVRPAQAQYAPGMNGRANDANNLVGGGGLNAQAAPSFANSANLYVTGNVTRGAYFRGNSPIRDISTLFTTLPSSRIGGFERDALDARTAVNSRAP